MARARLALAGAAMITIGIDPGLSGGIVALDEFGELVSWCRMPTRKTKRGNAVDCRAVSIAISNVSGIVHPFVAIEDVWGRKGEAAKSAFSFGRSLGALEGCCAGFSIDPVFILPSRWQAHALPGKSRPKGKALKSALAARAIELWPDLAETLNIKAAWGIADAALIAEYARRISNG